MKKIITFFIILLMITTTTLSALGNSTNKNTLDNQKDWKASESTTPKTKPTNFLYEWLFKQHPNDFIILKYLLVTGGFFDRLVEEGTGKLSIKLTDAPGFNITEALVTISHVNVHYAGTNDTNNTEGEWITVINEPQTFDLVQLQNATVLLGETDLTAGWYTQIRLFVDQALVTIDGTQYDLKIPSKKIKLITPFLVQDNDTLTLTLDFDVQKSIHQAAFNKYIMRPTIKVIQG